MTQPKFLCDVNWRRRLVAGVLRGAPGVDILVHERAGLDGLDDFAVLRRARDLGRLLLTHDVGICAAFGKFVRAGEASAGLVIAPAALADRTVIESICLIAAATDAREWVNVCQWLPL